MINDEQKLINIQAIGDVLTRVFKLNCKLLNKIVPFSGWNIILKINVVLCIRN